AWRSEKVIVGTRHAELGFRRVEPRREIRIAQRPVLADTVTASQLQVGRQQTERRTEPMPRGPTHQAQISAAERVGSILLDVGILNGGRALGIGRHFKGASGTLIAARSSRFRATPRSTCGPASTTVTRAPAPA